MDNNPDDMQIESGPDVSLNDAEVVINYRPDKIKELSEYGQLLELSSKDETFVLHPLAQSLKDGQGGMLLHDPKCEINQAIKHIAKQVSGAALKGQVLDMFKIPTPAYIHYKGTQLNLIQNDLICLQYLNKAVPMSDPLDRMKQVVKYFVASNWVNQTLANCKVPLNPILGETLQREMVTGERLYCEQVSHHPPISAFELYGPNDDYKIYGHQQYKGWLSGASSFAGNKQGKCFLEFKDGQKIEFKNCPAMMIENIFNQTKKAVYYDGINFIDEENGIDAAIRYNPNFNQGVSGIAYRNTFGWLPGMNGLGTNKTQNRPARADDVTVEISKKSGSNKKSKPEVVSKGHGSWLSHLILDGEVVWRIESEVPQWESFSDDKKFSDGTVLLESDSHLRTDFMEMLSEKWEEAENQKLDLEKQQRKDKTGRSEAEKRNKKKR